MFIKKKHIITIIFTLIMVLLTGCNSDSRETSQNAIESGKAITMFITNDIHYLARDLNDNCEAFQTYIAAGDGRQLNYIDEITDAFANDVDKKRPDILIISGDLTNNGEKESHLKLAEKLRAIEKSAGTRIFVIPGNHDIQNPWARGFQGKDQYVTDSIDSDEFKKIYWEFGYGEAISRDKASLSYLAAPSEDVWLLMLDTNVYKTNYKYGTPASYGQISEKTFEWIRQCSRLAKEKNARIVTVMHHNLLKHSYIMNNGFTIDNSDDAIKVFEDCSLNLVLSGHIHIQDIKSDGEEPNTIYDIATSALSVYPEQYGILTYEPTEGFDYSTSRVDVEGWAKEAGITDENMINFKEYSRDYFGAASYKKTYNRLTEAGIYSEQDKKLMAETMSLLNINYFGGTVDAVREEVLQSQGFKLLKAVTEPEFMPDYVRSMVYDYKINNNQLHIPLKD